MRLLSIPELEKKHNSGKTRLYERGADGTLTPFVKVGRRSMLPEDESDAILEADVAGVSDAEKRVLVQKLVEHRSERYRTRASALGMSLQSESVAGAL